MSLVDYRKTLFLFLFTLALIAQATPAEARILLGASNNTSLSNGLVGYWPLDGAVTNWNTNTTLDLSGQGNTGQLNAMSTTSSPVAGKIGQALKLDGTDDYVNLGKGSSLDFQTGSMSISAWVNFDSTSGGHIVSDIDSSLSFAQEDFAVSNGSLTFQVFGDASNFKLWGTAAIVSSGKRYHIVATRNGSSLNDGDVKIYVNGDSKSLTPIPVGTPFVPALASVGNLSIGRSGDSNSGYFKGKIDDVRIYNRALSASEIAQLYKLGTANAAHSQSGPNAPLSNGLVGYWTSDGGATNWATGQTQDATGNGYTGSLIAMSTSSSPVAGKIGQALKFNGANYTRVPSAPNLDIAAYTISGWVNGSNTNKDIISIIYSTAAAEQRIIINSAYVFISNDDNGLGIDCITSDVFAANKWHHFVAVQQSKSSRKLYVDGILECTSTYSNAAFSGTPTLYIGSKDGTTRFLTGSVDDVRIYNRALSATEVAQLYKLGTANAAHSAAGPNAPLSNGLVGYWPLDGSVTNWATGQTQDLSGNGNVGSLVSMSTTSAPVAGKMGQALNFDLGGYITAVDQSSPNPSDITVSAWIKLSADGSAFRYLLDKTSGGGGYLFKYTLAGATLITGGSGRSSGISYPLNTWHHIVGSYQSGSNQIRLYSDGVLADVGTGGAMTTNSGSLTIGNGPGGTFKGVVDDIRIYNRVLSGSEVAQLYNMGR